MITLKEAIAARGLKERSPRRSALRGDRPKLWAGSKCHSRWLYDCTNAEFAAANEALNQTEDTAAYVRAWELLNHLKIS